MQDIGLKEVERNAMIGGQNGPIEKYIKFELRIVDNGQGIKPENIDKLFMNFSKLEEHADKNR